MCADEMLLNFKYDTNQKSSSFLIISYSKLDSILKLHNFITRFP